jgi:molybdate transport system ATP-binding protein
MNDAGTLCTETVGLRLTGQFGGFTLDCEAAFAAQGITVLVGPSGSGKTTLLRCIAGLERAKGTVRIGREVWQDATNFVPTHKRGAGYVFQEPSLLPHLSVAGNLRYALRRAAVPGSAPQGGAPAAEADLLEIVEMLGIGPLLERRPDTLSGGERQRVAIGRALLARPRLLLMDEPLSSLDAAAKAEIMPYLDTVHRRLKAPVLYVTHDAVEAAHLADRVLTMRQGKLTGPVERTTGGERAAGERAGRDGGALALLGEAQIRALARAALAAGLQPPDIAEG